MVEEKHEAVYFGVGGSFKPVPANKRLAAGNVDFIPGYWVDIDLYNPGAHATHELPLTVSDALDCLPRELEPSLVVNSGNGIHVYWLFRELWDFTTDNERRRAAITLERLQQLIRQKFAVQGWKLDATHDLSRVLRVPGSLNYKTTPPKLVEMVHEGNMRYNPREIEEILEVYMGQITLPQEQNMQSQETVSGATEFKPRETDGDASLMIDNCRFIQYCAQSAKDITYDAWMAMISNLARAKNGEKAVHTLSASDEARYDFQTTQAKIEEALNRMKPISCKRIQDALGYRGCPEGGCGIKCPSGWALDDFGKARAFLETYEPDDDGTESIEMHNALRIVRKKNPKLAKEYEASLKAKGVDFKKPKPIPTETITPDNGIYLQDEGILPSAPVNLRVPVHYNVSEYGIISQKPDLEGNIRRYPATSTPIIITKRFKNIDTQLERVELQFLWRGIWRSIATERQTIADARRIIQLANSGVHVSSESSKYLVKWFYDLQAINDDNIPLVQTVSKLGWLGDKFILPTLNSEYIADVSDAGGASIISGLKLSGTPEDHIKILLRARNGGGYASRFMLGAGFTAPLLHVCKARNLVLHNWGGSEAGKSALATASASIWGDPARIATTFDQTDSGFERRAALMNDLPFIVDEREVMSNEQRDNTSVIVYRLVQGKSRGRATITGLQNFETWRTVIISTGEGPLTTSRSKDGEVNRILEIEGGPYEGNIELSKWIYSATSECYGHVGAMFVKELLKADHNAIRKRYDFFVRMISEQFPDQASTPTSNIALIAVAGELAAQWIFGEDEATAKQDAMEAALWAADNRPIRSSTSEAQRAWDNLQGFIAENTSKYYSLNTMRDPLIWHGYVLNGNTYILRTVLNNWLDSNYSSARKVLKEWASMGLIETYTQAGKTRLDILSSRIIPMQRTRVVKLNTLLPFEEEEDEG